MFTLSPNALFVTHQGQDGGAGLSPRLWGKLNGQMFTPDGQQPGFYVWDDFLNTKIDADNTNGYQYYADTGGTVTQITGVPGGVINITTDNTDNDEVWIAAGGGTGVLGTISDTAGSDKLTIFEARVKFTQVTDTYNAFIGLAEEGEADGDTITDAGALASIDLLGFWVLEADGNSLNFGYRKAGQTAQTTISGVQALTAATWYKLGFVYDPLAPAAKRISVFVDNVEQSKYVTATNIAAATFPDGEFLTFLAGVKNQTTTISSIYIDWWAFYQAR